jgi:hypothetical protein
VNICGAAQTKKPQLTGCIIEILVQLASLYRAGVVREPRSQAARENFPARLIICDFLSPCPFSFLFFVFLKLFFCF